jgi:alpha-amylase/alpha-mannosidase (GH57 family)
VYGTFSTWIGDPDKNRAWEMLVEAKIVYDRVIASDQLDAEQQENAAIQLARCEGSDWFWWFGDYNPGDTVSDFERLFRLQLTHLYRLLGESPPDYLSAIFAHGSGDPSLGGVMRQNA